MTTVSTSATSGASAPAGAPRRPSGVGHWIRLESERIAGPSGASCGSIGWPGLWRPDANRPEARAVFEAPRWLVRARHVDGDIDEDDDALSLDALQNWAEESARGAIDPAWRPPARQVVEGWLPAGDLTLRARGFVRQGVLTVEPHRWALAFMLLARPREAVPPSRGIALAAMLAEGHRRWRTVRFGWGTTTAGGALVAETDLTGAPHSEPLLRTALAALRHAVAQLVESVELLTDPELLFRAPDLCFPATETTNQRTKAR